MKRKYILLVIILVLAAILGWYFLIWSKKDTSNTSDAINYGPATENEQRESEQHKDDLIEQQKNTDNDATGQKKQVKPTITYWGQDSPSSDFEISGYVTGAIEGNGTCTVSLTKGDNTVTQNRLSYPGPQSTTCGTISIPASKLSPGEWEAKLSYTSATAVGTSEVVMVSVK